MDRSIEAAHGHIVVAVLDGELTVKRLHKKDGHVQLKPENAAYQPILIHSEQECLIWCVVTGSIRQFQK